MKAFRVWFKDDSAVLVNANDDTSARVRARSIALTNQGPSPAVDTEDWRRYMKAISVRKVEQLG